MQQQFGISSLIFNHLPLHLDVTCSCVLQHSLSIWAKTSFCWCLFYMHYISEWALCKLPLLWKLFFLHLRFLGSAWTPVHSKHIFWSHNTSIFELANA
jgi:hypothetical protein